VAKNDGTDYQAGGSGRENGFLDGGGAKMEADRMASVVERRWRCNGRCDLLRLLSRRMDEQIVGAALDVVVPIFLGKQIAHKILVTSGMTRGQLGLHRRRRQKRARTDLRALVDPRNGGSHS
jgi:hypothetical protein